MEFPFKSWIKVGVIVFLLVLSAGWRPTAIAWEGMPPQPGDWLFVAVAGYVIGSLAEWLLRTVGRTARRA